MLKQLISITALGLGLGLLLSSPAEAQQQVKYHNRCVYYITEQVDTHCYRDRQGNYHTFNGHTIRIIHTPFADYQCAYGLPVLIDGSKGCEEDRPNSMSYFKLNGLFTFSYFRQR